MSPPAHHGAATNYSEEELGKVFDLRLFRRVSHYLKPYRWWIGAAIFLAILVAVIRIFTPWVARYIIDNFIPSQSGDERQDLLKAMGLYMGLLLFSLAGNFTLAYITAWVGQKVMVDLRGDIFRKLHALSLRFFDRNPTGRLLTRATTDVQVLNDFLAHGVVYIFADFVMLFGILIVWIWYDWKLALVLLLTGPLMGVAAYNFRIRARKAYREVRLRIAALNAYLQENLAGVRTVQAFNREAGSLKKFAEINKLHLTAYVNTVKEFARFFPIVETVSNLGVVLVLAYGGWQVLSLAETQLSPGDFYLYIQYIAWFFMPIQELAEKYNIFQSAMASAERIFILQDEEVEVKDPENPKPVHPLQDKVEFRDVWFAYAPPEQTEGVEWILKGVSLEVPKGHNVALVGATGAGKSTVINLLTRLYDVQKGCLCYDGVNIREYSQRQLRKRMAIVLQDVFLFSGTIAENIRLGDPNISDAQVEAAARYVNAHSFIEKLSGGYNHPVRERGATLSTGQKQLLAFARAIAHDPDLLVLDEATSNIDTETEALIQDALEKIMRDRTCIIVAHRLSTIQSADSIVVFHHGRIHEQGNHQELLQRDGLYRRLYELQYQS